MKMDPTELAGLIKDLLPMLREATEVVKYQKTNHSGAELLGSGVEKLSNGEPVVRGRKYLIKTPIVRNIDHEAKIKKIIKEAKTHAQLENDLAGYLAKHGKSLEAIKAKK